MTQKLIGYRILINTKVAYFELPVFFDAMPIDERRVTKEIRNVFTKNRMTHISVDMVDDFVFLVASDGDEIQIFALDPFDVWPVEFNSEFYKSGGDNK